MFSLGRSTLRQQRKFRQFIIITIILPIRHYANCRFYDCREKLRRERRFKQIANAVLQQSDRLLQGSKLPGTHDCDGHLEIE